jgi:hypothetical protein
MPARAARNPSRSRARPECRQSAAADGLRRGGAGAARLLHAGASPHVRHAAVAAGSRRRRRGKGCPDTGGARWQGAALMLDVGAGSLRAEEAAPGKKLVAAVSASIYQAPVFDHGPGADASPEAPRHRHGAQAGAALNARCRDQIFGRRGNDIFDSARARTLPRCSSISTITRTERPALSHRYFPCKTNEASKGLSSLPMNVDFPLSFLFSNGFCAGRQREPGRMARICATVHWLLVP